MELMLLLHGAASGDIGGVVGLCRMISVRLAIRYFRYFASSIAWSQSFAVLAVFGGLCKHNTAFSCHLTIERVTEHVS